MTLVNTFGSTCTDKDILIVICHANHFVWYDLANRENEVDIPFKQQFVDLCRPGEIASALSYLFDKLCRHCSQCYDIFAPVMDPKKVGRCLTKHMADLFCRHRRVCTQSRKDIREFVTEILPAMFGQLTGARRQACVIGGDD